MYLTFDDYEMYDEPLRLALRKMVNKAGPRNKLDFLFFEKEDGNVVVRIYVKYCGMSGWMSNGDCIWFKEETGELNYKAGHSMYEDLIRRWINYIKEQKRHRFFPLKQEIIERAMSPDLVFRNCTFFE